MGIYHKYTDNYIQNTVSKSMTKNMMMRSFEVTTTKSVCHCFKWQRYYFCRIISWTQKICRRLCCICNNYAHLQGTRMRAEGQANEVMRYKMLLMWRWGQGAHLGLCKTHNYRIYKYIHILGTTKTQLQALWYIRQSFASCNIT